MREMKLKVKTMFRLLQVVQMMPWLDSIFVCPFSSCFTLDCVNLLSYLLILSFILSNIQTAKCWQIYFARYKTKRQGMWMCIKHSSCFWWPFQGPAGPLLWHVPNCLLVQNMLIVSRLPYSPFTSVFSAVQVFTVCPNWFRSLAVKVRTCRVIVCSLYVQKEPRVLITSLHPPSTLFPSGQ